jgi:hypothetical protein
VLLGAALSRVQEFGLQVLMMADQRERAQQFYDDLRSRIVAADPSRVNDLFPEWRSPAEVERAAYGIGADGQPDLDRMDDSLVVWRVPASEEEHADLERWLTENQVGVVGAQELPAGGEWV